MLHLLIVEDNSADVLLVREALRQCAIAADVVIASDGQRAIQVLSQPDFRPDFILLDLNLPKVDGFQVLEHFQGDAGAPVVVLTSSENPEDRRRALAIGASGYFTKPYGMDAWKRTICGIVERWSPGKSMRADSAN
jgi:CheY-like chemotaxis protein